MTIQLPDGIYKNKEPKKTNEGLYESSELGQCLEYIDIGITEFPPTGWISINEDKGNFTPLDDTEFSYKFHSGSGNVATHLFKILKLKEKRMFMYDISHTLAKRIIKDGNWKKVFTVPKWDRRKRPKRYRDIIEYKPKVNQSHNKKKNKLCEVSVNSPHG